MGKAGDLITKHADVHGIEVSEKYDDDKMKDMHDVDASYAEKLVKKMEGAGYHCDCKESGEGKKMIRVREDDDMDKAKKDLDKYEKEMKDESK
jgi:hypothetical protein